MAGPLTPNVRKRLETLRSHDPAHRVGVILTLSPGVSALTFAAPGLDVDHRIPEPPLVMGSATCAVALALARVAGIARLEIDEGGVHALRSRE
jgi:hypothetical protein